MRWKQKKLKDETLGKKLQLLVNSYPKSNGVHKTQARVLNSKKLLKNKGKNSKIMQKLSKIKQKTLKPQNSKEFVLIKSLRCRAAGRPA